MFALQIEELHLAHAKVPQSNTLAVDASVVGTAELPRASAGAPQAGSLSLMLVQALHSNDATLLEQVCRPFENSKSRILPHYYPFCIIVCQLTSFSQCLAYTNAKLVQKTVVRLPPKYVVPFLQLVVAKFQVKKVLHEYICAAVLRIETIISRTLRLI